MDKNATREDALFDIYRVMRPGEPPTVETAEAMFHSLFFDPERYDLSAVGRVKMNMRHGPRAPDTVRMLRKEDIVAVVRHSSTCVTAAARSTTSTISATAVCARSANSWRTISPGLLRMERAIKERMSSVDIDT